MAKKKPAKKPTRGSGVSVTLPTEPLAAGMPTTAPIMAVMVQDEGTPMASNMKLRKGSPSSSASEGRSRHSWSGLALHRDSDMFLDADGGNVEPVTVDYEQCAFRPTESLVCSP